MGGTVIAVALIVVLVVALSAIVLAAASVRVLREYERGVVFRLGRVIDQKGPGLVLLIPAVDRMVRVSLRTVTLRIPPQEVITRDNVPVRVAAVAYFRVIDPRCSVLEVEDFMAATLQIAQTTLRSVLGKAELDELLSERERLNENLQQIIDEQTEPWGIKVTIVEIKDVEIPERMQHALARQAEAERNRRAKVINAEGEFQAADRLADAAEVIRPNPVTIQLRYLQALSEISANQGTTIVFPLPMDVLRPLIEAGTGNGAEASERKRTERPAGSHELTEGGPGQEPERELTEGGPGQEPERQPADGEPGQESERQPADGEPGQESERQPADGEPAPLP
jgi:SPFH domain / Band 7 family